MSDILDPPPYSTLNYIGFQDLNHPNSGTGLEGMSSPDDGSSLAQTFGKNVYNNVP